MSASPDKEADNRLAKLRILGKEVTIGCRPGEEDALKQAAAYIDASMRDLKARNATSSLEKIAIVTAINTADALLKARAGQSRGQSSGLAGGQSQGVNSLLADDLDPEQLRGRLATLNASLDDLLDDPDTASEGGAAA